MFEKHGAMFGDTVSIIHKDNAPKSIRQKTSILQACVLEKKCINFPCSVCKKPQFWMVKIFPTKKPFFFS